jgi:SAM-dependent methyltransferase
MRPNYPAATNGGVSQQGYEAQTLAQRNGVKTLLKAAGIQVEGLRTVVDIGCRNGDTTLGLLQATPKTTQVFAVEECLDALLIAKVKFGGGTATEFVSVSRLLSKLPPRWLDTFAEDAKPVGWRATFVHSPIAKMASKLPFPSTVDLAVGYQALHWLDADYLGRLSTQVVKGIYESLAAGGVFLAGTSTAFVSLPREFSVEGKTVAQFSIDEHPYVKMIYAEIAKLALTWPRKTEPERLKGRISLDGIAKQLTKIGFSAVETGGYLYTPGREKVITDVVKLRPAHQGMLGGIPENDRAELVEMAIGAANQKCDEIARNGQDPRLVETNIWDVVPFIKATRP